MDASRALSPSITGYTIVRLLIASYFAAFAIGAIEGTDMGVLLRHFLDPVPAAMIANGAVLGAAAAIVVGWQRRGAALVLALMLFFASYLSMLEQPTQGLGPFWRDLALIGALILTYADSENHGNDAVALFRRLPRSGSGRGARKPSVEAAETRPLSRGSVESAFARDARGSATSRLATSSAVRPFPDDLGRSR